MHTAGLQKAEIFQIALGLNAEQRGLFLQQACGENAGLRAEIEALLGAHEKAGTFLDTATSQRVATVKLAISEVEGLGTVIGRYRILEKVGEGGFGTVYVAEQREPVRRRVALKIIKLGMDTRQVVARFEAERQALAMMDHPNIAKVLDAGTTDTGRPYFVMELVQGIRVTEYCDQNQLATTARLELFVKICQAIQHAHQKGIIHRDIKPSNILVTLHDGVAAPKVIDFGIAKATQGELTDKTLYTQLHQFIGTPAYMSPEQAEMSGMDIDTRSDIYSLGVLLYELLTGRTPFDQKVLLEAGLDQMRRIIREQEPMRPSTRVNSLLGEERTATAKLRGSDAPRLIHVLRGDLDWIVMKCLEKDRTRRYETANGLAVDVLRHLQNEPIVARPPGKLYRFRKAVQRNKLIYSAAGVTSLALLGGVAASLWQAAAARSERDAAMGARQQAEAINRFLTEGLLYQATPDQNPRDRKITIEEGLRVAAEKLDQDPDLSRHPETEAALRLAVGTTCSKLELLDEAERNLRRAWDLRRESLGPLNEQTLVAKQAFADFLNDARKRYAESEELSRETWEARRKMLGPEHPQTLASLDTYSIVMALQRKFVLAEPLLRKCLESRERILGPNNKATLSTLANLGLLLTLEGRLKEAEQVFRQAIERRHQAGLENTEDTYATIHNLGLSLLYQGRLNEAEEVINDLRIRAVSFFGPEQIHTLHIQHTLVRVLTDEGKLDEAEQLARETLEVRLRKTRNEEGTGRILLYLGRILAQKGQLEEGELRLNQALELFRQYCSSQRYLAAWTENWLGAVKLAGKAYPEAATLLLPDVQTLLEAAAGEMSPMERRQTLSHVVELYRALGKPDLATSWQKRLDGIEAGNSLSATNHL